MRFIRFALFTNTLKFAQNNCNCYDIVTINKKLSCHSDIYNCYDNCYDDKHKKTAPKQRMRVVFMFIFCICLFLNLYLDFL